MSLQSVESKLYVRRLYLHRHHFTVAHPFFHPKVPLEEAVECIRMSNYSYIILLTRLKSNKKGIDSLFQCLLWFKISKLHEMSLRFSWVFTTATLK